MNIKTVVGIAAICCYVVALCLTMPNAPQPWTVRFQLAGHLFVALLLTLWVAGQ